MRTRWLNNGFSAGSDVNGRFAESVAIVVLVRAKPSELSMKILLEFCLSFLSIENVAIGNIAQN